MLDPFSTWLLLAAVGLAVYLFVFFERSGPIESAPVESAPAVSDSTKYAESIALDMRALEWLDDVGYFEDIDDLDDEQLSEIDPAELRAAKFLAEDLRYRYDEAGDWSGAYFCDVLDIENYYKGSAGDRPDLYKVSALVSFGGPNAWIDVEDGSAWLNIRVYWGGDSATREVYAPSVVASLWSHGEILDYIEAMA